MSITSVFERVKSRDINWRRVFFVGVFVALFLEFYLNLFGTVNMQYFVNFQADSEDLVLGKIRDAISGDIFSNGGFLHRDINSVFGQGTYLSQIGLQAFIFGILGFILSLFTSMGVEGIYGTCRLITAALTAFTLTYVIKWVSDEFEIRRSLLLVIPVLFILSIPVPYYFIGMARNLYWVPFTWFIPLIIMISLNKYKRNEKIGYPVVGLILIALSVFIKCACGFDYSSSVLIAGSIPLFYYGVKEHIAMKSFIIRFIQYFISAMVGVLFTIFVYLIQLSSYYGTIDKAIDYLIYFISKRTYGGIGNVQIPEVYQASLTAPVIDVVFTYLKPVLPLVGILILLSIATIVFRLLAKKQIITVCTNGLVDNKVFAGVIASWISFLAPLSWYILVKGHSYIHTHMNFVLWDFPFIVIFIGLCLYILHKLACCIGNRVQRLIYIIEAFITSFVLIPSLFICIIRELSTNVTGGNVSMINYNSVTSALTVITNDVESVFVILLSNPLMILVFIFCMVIIIFLSYLFFHEFVLLFRNTKGGN